MSSEPAGAGPAPARTPLHALHLELGAKMVPFAGWALPLAYPAGILAEHRHTRAAASLFDVSHMGQLELRGAGARRRLEALAPVDALDLPASRQRYTYLTNERAGIIDDLMASGAEDGVDVVCNAANAERVVAHLEAALAGEGSVAVRRDRALLALQGPAAAEVLARRAPGAADLWFMDVAWLEVGGHRCRVSRSGYTGEDGFEIAVPAPAAEALARDLLADPEVRPAGLGARDSLRLEAGLCLHGHDIDEDTTPVEAGIAWAIPRVRRPGGERAGGYPGHDVIARELESGAARRRVGIRPLGRAPVRAGAPLRRAGTEDAIGRVSSGGFGPSLDAPVAMGYVPAELAAPGTRLDAVVRGRALPVEVARLPFVAHRYRHR